MNDLRLHLTEDDTDGNIRIDKVVPVKLGERFTIGRGPDCDYSPKVGSKLLSVTHCTITRVSDGWRIVDGLADSSGSLPTKPSKNGIHDQLGNRATSIALMSEGAYVDLLPQDLPIRVRLIVKRPLPVTDLATYSRSSQACMETMGSGEYDLQSVKGDLQSLQGDMVKLTTIVETLIKNDDDQNRKLSIVKYIVVSTLGLSLMLGIISVKDHDRRDQWIEVAVNFAIAGLSVYTGSNVLNHRNDSTKEDQ